MKSYYFKLIIERIKTHKYKRFQKILKTIVSKGNFIQNDKKSSNKIFTRVVMFIEKQISLQIV